MTGKKSLIRREGAIGHSNLFEKNVPSAILEIKNFNGLLKYYSDIRNKPEKKALVIDVFGWS
jgi:hypothetical protein